MTAPRLADVYTSTVELAPLTWCEMPDGARCEWAPRPTALIGRGAARRHALDNPGHYITREEIRRTRWVLDPTLTPGG